MTLFSFCFVADLHGQNNVESSLIENQQFISRTIRKYSYNSKEDGIKNNFIISFKDSLVFINNLKGYTIYFTTFKISDINSIVITEKEFNVLLIILLKPGKMESTFLDSQPMKTALGLYEIVLDKNFLQDSLPVKIQDAFAGLTSHSKP